MESGEVEVNGVKIPRVGRLFGSCDMLQKLENLWVAYDFIFCIFVG